MHVASRTHPVQTGVADPATARIADVNRDGRLDLPGLVHRRGAEVVANPPRRPEVFPGAPRRDPELVRYYWDLGGVLNVQLQRGCPHACVYCSYPGLEGRRLRRRPVEDAVDEIVDSVLDAADVEILEDLGDGPAVAPGPAARKPPAGSPGRAARTWKLISVSAAPEGRASSRRYPVSWSCQ